MARSKQWGIIGWIPGLSLGIGNVGFGLIPVKAGIRIASDHMGEDDPRIDRVYGVSRYKQVGGDADSEQWKLFLALQGLMYIFSIFRCIRGTQSAEISPCR